MTEYRQALALESNTGSLHGQRMGLKIHKELMLFKEVFKLEKDALSLHREIRDEEIPRIVLEIGFKTNTPLKALVLQKELGLGELAPFRLAPDYSIFLPTNRDVVDRWVDQLYAKRVKMVGFDTETPPAFRGNSDKRVALLQFASPYSCLLLHIPTIKTIPESIIRLLGDETIAKTGFGVKADCDLLLTQHHIKTKSALDISHSCRLLGLQLSNWKEIGVQTGSAYLLSLYVEKPKSVTLSDWKATALSLRQVEYSAMDAVMSLNCMLQALALRPESRVPGLCSVPADYTLALSVGSSMLIIAFSCSSAGENELLFHLIKCEDTCSSLTIYPMFTPDRVSITDERVTALLEHALLCTEVLEVERVLTALEPSHRYQSRYLHSVRIPVNFTNRIGPEAGIRVLRTDR